MQVLRCPRYGFDQHNLAPNGCRRRRWWRGGDEGNRFRNNTSALRRRRSPDRNLGRGINSATFAAASTTPAAEGPRSLNAGGNKTRAAPVQAQNDSAASEDARATSCSPIHRVDQQRCSRKGRHSARLALHEELRTGSSAPNQRADAPISATSVTPGAPKLNDRHDDATSHGLKVASRTHGHKKQGNSLEVSKLQSNTKNCNMRPGTTSKQEQIHNREKYRPVTHVWRTICIL